QLAFLAEHARNAAHLLDEFDQPVRVDRGGDAGAELFRSRHVHSPLVGVKIRSKILYLTKFRLGPAPLASSSALARERLPPVRPAAPARPGTRGPGRHPGR